MTQFTRKQESEIDPNDIWGNDAFGTLASYATFLTNALVADGGNFVLNVNGAWGTGKTFFVNRWAEQLRQAGHPVVEFNAWENDSAEDPLAPLIAALINSQKEILPPTIGDKLKQGCGKYIMAGGGFIVRAGLKQLVGDRGIDSVNDMLSSDSENELIKLAGQHVEEQLEKQKAARGIAQQLEGFVAAIEAHADLKLPMFIFIDELDRCRPTFAIELLERVKHLFHVDGIKFVITTDSRQLAHSICGAYGSGFDGTTYLRRFFDETFTLPEPDHFLFAKHLFTGKTYQNWKIAFADGMPPGKIFSNLSAAFALSLRDQVQIFHRTTAVLANIGDRQQEVILIYLLFLTILRMKDPEVYEQLIRRNEKQPAWKEALRNSTFKESYYVTLLDWCFKYLDMTYAEARKHWHDTGNDVNVHDRTERDWMINQIQQTILNNYQGLQEYPMYIELASTLS